MGEGDVCLAWSQRPCKLAGQSEASSHAQVWSVAGFTQCGQAGQPALLLTQLLSVFGGGLAPPLAASLKH